MNKTQTKDYIREMIKRYDEFGPLSAEDFAFMLKVLEGHEYAKEKIGCGVKKMWLENTIYNNKGFWLERTDGSRIDFSFIKCFVKSTSKKADFLKACRKAVEPIVIRFRDSVFQENKTIQCPILDIPITKHESHVDHDQPFAFIKIARMFVIINNIDLDKVQYNHGIGVEFADNQLEYSWLQYHTKMANLRVISAKANQQIPKEKW